MLKTKNLTILHMDSVWMKIVLKNIQNSLPGHPHHQIFQSRHQILACWSWDWTSLATASFSLGNALLLEKKVGPNGWVPAHLDHCACLGLVRRLAHRHTDDAVCSIASHNNELPMLRISIDPHWSTQQKTTEVLRSTNLNQRLSFHQIPDWIWHLHTFSKGPMQGQRLPSDPQQKKNSSCSQAYASSITINLFSTAHSPAIPWDLGILHSSPNFETEFLVRFHFEQSNRISYIRMHNRNTCGFHLFKKDFWASWLDWLFCYPNRRHGSVLISISESVAIESSSSALHHCRVISIIHGPLVNVRFNVHIYIYMILILQQFWHFPLALTPTMFLRFYLEQILQWCWIKRIFQ